MRTVMYAINISIDGCCDHTKFGGDGEMLDYFTGLMKDVDQLVYGRIMYQLMFPYWTDSATAQSATKEEKVFGQTITAIDKVVFSQSLSSVEAGTRIVRTNPVDEIRKLKQQPGKTISLGSVSLLSTFMAAGLIDEYYFVVHPVIVGEGRRLLEGIDLRENFNLKLVDSMNIKSGRVALHYRKQ